MHGWLSLEGVPRATEKRFLVAIRLTLRSLLKIREAVPDPARVLRALDATEAYGLHGTSYEPLSQRLLDRARAGTVRRIRANRLPVSTDEEWASGAVATEVASVLAQQPPSLLELQMTGEVAAAPSGRYLEKLLGVAYGGKGSYVPCTRLRILQLGRNGLKGGVPAALALCTGLTRLELHENALDGKVPEELTAGLPKLRVLRLQGNPLTGELPTHWATCELELLDTSHTMMTGTLPKAIVGMGCLETLNVSHARLNGQLPSGANTWQCAALRVFRVDNNRLGGDIPRELFDVCTRLEVALLNNNTLGGEIPGSVRNCHELVELDLHTNFLTGSVPCYELKSCPRLRLLNLMHQRGEEPLVAKTDTGDKAALVRRRTRAACPSRPLALRPAHTHHARLPSSPSRSPPARPSSSPPSSG